MAMEIPKKYFHDRLVLLLLSVNTFLVILTSVLVLLRLDSSSADSYIVQYRSNLGLGAFQAGNASTFLSFIAFSVFILVSHTILSMRIYDSKRQYAVTILSMALILIVFALVVSNALLVLR